VFAAAPLRGDWPAAQRSARQPTQGLEARALALCRVERCGSSGGGALPNDETATWFSGGTFGSTGGRCQPRVFDERRPEQLASKIGLPASSAGFRFVPRYRLRFAFQEIDLPSGFFVIGRGRDCQLTLDDPLISREHARIRVSETGVVIEDLGSRNGVFINGLRTHGAVKLEDGDRLRVGRQELVFGISEGGIEGASKTGSMCYCAKCGVPFALALVRCPACGSRDRDGVPAPSRPAADSAWRLELATEALARAVRLESWQEAERLLGSVRPEVEGRISAQAVIEEKVLEKLADAAVSLAAARADAGWARWILSIYALLSRLPAAPLSETLSTLPPAQRSTLMPAARRVMESVETSGGPRLEDIDAFKGFEVLLARLADG
jgi:hypothetical protein